MTDSKRAGNSEEVDEALRELTEGSATRETPDEVAKVIEEVVEAASAAAPHPHGRGPRGRCRGTTAGVMGVEEAARDSDEAVEGPLRRRVDEVLEEAVHPHLPFSDAVEGGVEVCLEEVGMAVPRPQRRRPSSRLALLWRWLPSHFGDRGWRL